MELVVCLFNSTHLRQVKSQMLPRNAFLDCLEEGAMDYLLFSQGSGDPAEILLIQLSPGKPWATIWSFLYFLCKVAASYCRGPRVGSRSCSGPPCPTRWGKRNYSHLPPTTEQPDQCAFLLSRPTNTNFKTSNRSGSSAMCVRVHFHSSCRSSRGEA